MRKKRQVGCLGKTIGMTGDREMSTWDMKDHEAMPAARSVWYKISIGVIFVEGLLPSMSLFSTSYKDPNM